MKILIIGGGNMGKTYARSFTGNHTVSKNDIYILEHTEHIAEALKHEGFQHVFTSAGSFVEEAELLLLAIKPQDRGALYQEIKDFVNPRQLVLTIMAGVKIADVQQALGVEKVVRAMPNLPVQISLGITGFTAGAGVSKADLFNIQNLLNTTGKSIYFDNEDKLDAVTAVSGSGPAYVFYFVESMIDAAMKLGFNRGEAELLVEQTFAGAVDLLHTSDIPCSEWIAKVASRGGTTEAALKVFKQKELSTVIAEGVKQAHLRAIELGS
jgi:pyrroline-5-carboxylate reductase